MSHVARDDMRSRVGVQAALDFGVEDRNDRVALHHVAAKLSQKAVIFPRFDLFGHGCGLVAVGDCQQ